MGYRRRAAAVFGVAGVLLAVNAGCDPQGSATGSGAPSSTPSDSTVEPVADGGPPATECDVDGFQLGNWEVSGAGAPGPVSGIAASGDASCVRLRINFDGPAPGVTVWRPSDGNHTYVRLAADFVAVDPVGPVDDDLLWPELDLLSSAILTSDQGGITVVAVHGDHADVAARAVVAERHVDVYFRAAAPGDASVDDVWPGGPHHLEVAGVGEQGLIVTHTGAYDGEWVVVQGYAKAPESHVEVRVQVTGEGVLCHRSLQAAGPPYLFSWFHDACQVPIPNNYLIQVGWPGVTGPTDDVWQWYEVLVH